MTDEEVLKQIGWAEEYLRLAKTERGDRRTLYITSAEKVLERLADEMWPYRTNRLERMCRRLLSEVEFHNRGFDYHTPLEVIESAKMAIGEEIPSENE